jgi:hypothetical protein
MVLMVANAQLAIMKTLMLVLLARPSMAMVAMSAMLLSAPSVQETLVVSQIIRSMIVLKVNVSTAKQTKSLIATTAKLAQLMTASVQSAVLLSVLNAPLTTTSRVTRLAHCVTLIVLPANVRMALVAQSVMVTTLL